MTFNRLLLALTVAFPGLSMAESSGHALAFIPLLVMAGITAASAIASSIAGAAQNEANLEAQTGENAKNRALQMKLAKQQLAEQKRQYSQSMEQNARQGVISSLQENASQAHQAQARNQAATNDVQGTLAKAFLRGG